MALKSPNQKNGAHYLVSTNPRTPETERLLLLRTSRNSDSALPSCKTIKCPSGYRLGWLAAKRQKIDRHGNAGLGLCGIPLCFKANIATGIFPTSAATPALINHLPKIPSRVAERLFQLEHCRVPRETCMSYRLELRATTMPPVRCGTRGIQV